MGPLCLTIYQKYWCRVKRAKRKHPDSWPLYQDLKPRQSLSLPQSQDAESHQLQSTKFTNCWECFRIRPQNTNNLNPSWKSPPMHTHTHTLLQEALYKLCILFSLLLLLTLKKTTHLDSFFPPTKSLQGGLLCGMTFSPEPSPVVTILTRVWAQQNCNTFDTDISLVEQTCYTSEDLSRIVTTLLRQSSPVWAKLLHLLSGNLSPE